jgi:DNA end-binding protein Ku
VPRSIFNGTITVGLAVVPIKVHSAVEDRSVHFHQVHAPDEGQIVQRRVCTAQDIEVPYEEIVMGYAVGADEYVVLTKDEIAAAAGAHSHLIEIEQFVPAAEIDPVFYERGYYLSAGDGGEAPYRLLHDALARCDRVGLARWVFHNREYLVAVRVHGELLVLQTMRFADELVAVDSLGLPEPSRAPSDREIEMAGRLVDALQGPFEPSGLTDTYRDRLMGLIEAKARGEAPDLPEAPDEPAELDLAAALEASLGRGAKR